jgi:hypothetical protein
MSALLALAAAAWLHAGAPPLVPCLFWPRAVDDDSLSSIRAAGIAQLCVPPENADGWRTAGIDVLPLDAADVSSRERVRTLGIEHRPDLVSATRSPWVNTNGWRFLRRPDGHYRYEVRAAAAPLAAAEAFAYGANAVLTIDPPQPSEIGRMLSFLRQLSPADGYEPLADFGVVDDGADDLGEVMNLLVRRNLLFERLQAPAPRYRINVVRDANGYSTAKMADPSEFALSIRHQLTDAARTIRIFGTEVVVCRPTGNAESVRLHLLNYGGRDIQGLRVRIRGKYRQRDAQVFGSGRIELQDFVVDGSATEFSIPRMTTYAVVDLTRVR